MISYLTSVVFASVALSLTNAADYVYTIPTVTNLLHGRGMGPVRSPGYMTARAEDNAFIKEALEERSRALEMSDFEIYPFKNLSGYSPYADIWQLRDEDYRRMFPLSFEDVRSRVNGNFGLGDGIAGYVKDNIDYNYNYLPLGEVTESDYAVNGNRGIFYALDGIGTWPTNDFHELEMTPGEPITDYYITNAYNVLSKTKAIAYKSGFAGSRAVSINRNANLLSVMIYTNDIETTYPLKIKVKNRQLTPTYSIHAENFQEYTILHGNETITNITCTSASVTNEPPIIRDESIDNSWKLYLDYTRQKTKTLLFGTRAKTTTLEDVYQVQKTLLAQTVEESDSGYYTGFELNYNLYAYIPVSIKDEENGAPSEYNACIGVFILKNTNLHRTVSDGAASQSQTIKSTNEYAVAYFPVTLARSKHGPDIVNSKPGYHLYEVNRLTAANIIRVIFQKLGNYDQIQMPDFTHTFKTEDVVSFSGINTSGIERNYESLSLIINTSVNLELYMVFNKNHHATFTERE